MLIDTWNLDIAMDNGIHDEEIKEMIGNDDELDEAIRYNLDLEEDDEEELYES